MQTINNIKNSGPAYSASISESDMRHTFFALTHDIARILGIDLPELPNDIDLSVEINLTIRGIEVSICHDIDTAADSLSILCEYGHIDEAAPPQMLASLLSENVKYPHIDRPIFFMPPDSHLLFQMRSLFINTTDAGKILNCAQDMVCQAREWKNKCETMPATLGSAEEFISWQQR